MVVNTFRSLVEMLEGDGVRGSSLLTPPQNHWLAKPLLMAFWKTW